MFIDLLLSEPADLCASSGILWSSPSNGWSTEDVVLMFPSRPSTAAGRRRSSWHSRLLHGPEEDRFLFTVTFLHMYQTVVFLIGRNKKAEIPSNPF